MFGRRWAPRVWCLGRRALGVSQGGRGAGAADRSCTSRVHRSQSALHGGLDDGRPDWHGLERGRADRRGGRLARLCTAWEGWGVPSRPVSTEDRGAAVCCTLPGVLRRGSLAGMRAPLILRGSGQGLLSLEQGQASMAAGGRAQRVGRRGGQHSRGPPRLLCFSVSCRAGPAGEA